MSKSSSIVDGKRVNIGDWVSFKSDYEQSGKITKITNSMGQDVLLLENENEFEGDYIGGDTETTVHSSDCWID
jgi:hypothetical protein